MFQPQDNSAIAYVSVIAGAAAGLGVRARAWWTGRNQAD